MEFMELMFDKHVIVAFLTLPFCGIILTVCYSLFVGIPRPIWRFIGCMVLFYVVFLIVVSYILYLIIW
jgi:hypothetical protein